MAFFLWQNTPCNKKCKKIWILSILILEVKRLSKTYLYIVFEAQQRLRFQIRVCQVTSKFVLTNFPFLVNYLLLPIVHAGNTCTMKNQYQMQHQHYRHQYYPTQIHCGVDSLYIIMGSKTEISIPYYLIKLKNSTLGSIFYELISYC